MSTSPIATQAEATTSQFFSGDPGITKIEKLSEEQSATVGSSFEVKLPWSSEKRFNVVDAPVGLTVGNRTGTVRWTPTPDQSGSCTAKINDGSQDLTLTINVGEATISEDLEAAGWLAPQGAKNGEGTYTATNKTFNYSNTFNAFRKSRTDFESTKTTIYLRGGVYLYGSGKEPYSKAINVEKPLPADVQSVPMLKLFGADGTTVVIKPWGNERVMFRGGVDGTMFRLNGICKNLRFENIELRGESNQKNYKNAIDDWWDGSSEFNGNGFAIAGRNITLKNCVIHEIMSQALACKESTNVTIEDCIIANSARWTIAGTTGIGFVAMLESNDAQTKASNKITGCLIYGVESRLFSHVYAKKNVHMTIDEGEGLLAQPQNQATGGIKPYKGVTLFENTALMHCGKGIVINGQPNCHIKNCTIYETGTTITGRSKLMRNNKSSKNSWKRCVMSSVQGGSGEFGAAASFGSPAAWDPDTSYNKTQGGFLFTVPKDGETYKTSDGTTLGVGKTAQLKYDDNRQAVNTPDSFTVAECLLTSFQGYWVEPIIEDCYATTNDDDGKVQDGIKFLQKVFKYSKSTSSIALDPSVEKDADINIGADPDHIAGLLDRSRSYSVDLEVSDYSTQLSTKTEVVLPSKEKVILNGYQKQTKEILDSLPDGLNLNYSKWHDSLPYTDDNGESHKEFSVSVVDGKRTVKEVLGVDELTLTIVHACPEPKDKKAPTEGD